ncbi:MAG: 30S ribosomal protein S6 [Clostridia bacterium]|nr:30S ribosomal protein S6 [Clostridia bacterium]
MNKYEVLYILEGAASDDAKAALIERFSTLVTSLNGTIVAIDKWGTKRFAYPIDFKNEGYYVLMSFEAPADVPAELERQMKNTDNVVRYLVARK